MRVRVWIIRQNSDAAFVRKYCVFAHKFPRNSIRSLLRILHLIAFSRMNRWFYIINNRSVISCASTDLQNGCL